MNVRKLNGSGWVLYVMDSCIHCHRQMELLKGFTNIVHCDRRSPHKNIKGYPCWFNSITGKVIYGYQDINNLKIMMGG